MLEIDFFCVPSSPGLSGRMLIRPIFKLLNFEEAKVRGIHAQCYKRRNSDEAYASDDLHIVHKIRFLCASCTLLVWAVVDGIGQCH